MRPSKDLLTPLTLTMIAKQFSFPSALFGCLQCFSINILLQRVEFGSNTAEKFEISRGEARKQSQSNYCHIFNTVIKV